MKLMALSICVLLLFIPGLVFSESASNEEHWEKVHKLEALAEKFKAETGFSGRVRYNYEREIIGSLEGKFADIQITAASDTIAFRDICERILDKILPYINTPRGQLNRGRIVFSQKNGSKTTDYLQAVNGYRVESLGFIEITYDAGRNGFAIGLNTVELPEIIVNPILTYDDVVKIYDEAINLNDEQGLNSAYLKKILKNIPIFRLMYCNIYSSDTTYREPEYRLCWVGGYGLRFYIDPVSGEIYKMIDTSG